MRVGGGSIDFFVRIGQLYSVIVLQGGKERTLAERRRSKSRELRYRQVDDLKGEWFLSAEPEAVDLHQVAGRGQREPGCDFCLVFDNFCREHSRARGKAAAGHVFGVAHEL